MTSPLVSTYHHILAHASSNPHRPAIICDGKSHSYGDLIRRINKQAASIHNAHSGKRHHVGIACQDKFEFLVSVFACYAIGCPAVPLNLSSPNTFLWTMKHGRCRSVIYDKDISLMDAPIGKLPRNVMIVSTERRYTGFTPHRINPSDMAMILYTSGTTGESGRGVLLTFDILANVSAAIIKIMKLGSNTVEYVAAPIHHAFGFGRCRAVLEAGGTIVMDNGEFNGAKVLLSMKSSGCNAISSVSTGLAALVDYFGEHLCKLSPQIKLVAMGSLFLSVLYKQKIVETFPHADIFMNYGLTEAMRSTFINLSKESSKIGSVGRPAPGVEVVILDDSGRILPPNSAGEIAVRGVNLARGYWKDENCFQKKTETGFFRTGDVGYLDQDGYLFYKDRADNMINSGGEKFSPLEVEQILKPILGKRKFCVCGVKDPNGFLGQLPVLCIEGNEDIRLDEIKNRLRPHLHEYKIPKKVYFIDRLPVTPARKIQTKLLRRQIEQQI